MSDLPDDLPDDAFLASLPWWLLLEPTPRSDEPGAGAGPLAPPGYVVIDVEDSTCLAVFTDEDLAERFAAAAGFGRGLVVAAETPAAFRRLIASLPPLCGHAAFDPPPRVGARARWVVPMAQVLSALEASEQDEGGAQDGDDDDDDSHRPGFPL